MSGEYILDMPSPRKEARKAHRRISSWGELPVIGYMPLVCPLKTKLYQSRRDGTPIGFVEIEETIPQG